MVCLLVRRRFPGPQHLLEGDRSLSQQFGLSGCYVNHRGCRPLWFGAIRQDEIDSALQLAGQFRQGQQISATADIGAGAGYWATQSSNQRSEERRVGKECRSRWSPSH